VSTNGGGPSSPSVTTSFFRCPTTARRTHGRTKLAACTFSMRTFWWGWPADGLRVQLRPTGSPIPVPWTITPSAARVARVAGLPWSGSTSTLRPSDTSAAVRTLFFESSHQSYKQMFESSQMSL